MAMTDLAIIRRSLTARMFSTCITILMVATAVGLMLVLLSMRDAGERAFRRGAGNMHMIVSRDDSALVAVLNGVFYASPPRRPIEWSKYEQIAVRPVMPAYRKIDWAIPIQQGDSYHGHPVLATTPEFFSKFQPEPHETWHFAAGGPFADAFEVVLGADVARQTGLQVDKQIFLNHGVDEQAHEHPEYRYTVVGILAPTGGPHDRAVFTDLNSSWVIHANDRRRHEDPNAAKATVEDLTDEDKLITGIYVHVATREGGQMSSSQPEVFDAFRRDASVVVASPSEEITKLLKIVSNIDRILLGMAAVVMISSGIAIMLALYNSMEQRRRQIAVLRVLGASRGRIFGLIITESAIIGIAGALAGLVLAFIGGQVVADQMRQQLDLVIEPQLPWNATVLLILVTIVLASAAGLVPALMGYRTSVVRNLRPLG